MTKFWQKATVWQKVKDTIQGSAAIMQVILVANESNHIWNYITAAVQIVTLFITTWGEDRDKDNVVDIFQEEVKVTVKSETPVEIEVKKEEIKPTPTE